MSTAVSFTLMHQRNRVNEKQRQDFMDCKLRLDVRRYST